MWPQVFRWAIGDPVEPEVNAYDIVRSAGSIGMSAASPLAPPLMPKAASSYMTSGRSMVDALSTIQNTSGANCFNWRTVSAAWLGGSRLILPVASAAASATVKW